MSAKAEDPASCRGQVFVFSGPSGVGKGSVIAGVLDRLGGVTLSISATTRPPRPGEQDGREYHFVDRPQFERMIEQGELLEWAEVYGNFYGTPSVAVTDLLDAGQDVILEIDVQGARSVRRAMPEAISIFVMPPSLDALRERLRRRGTDAAEAIESRLTEAGDELGEAKSFTFRIVNDDLDDAVSEAVDIIERCRKERAK